MSSAADKRVASLSQAEQLREGRTILRQEANALAGLSKRLGTEFCDAVQTVSNCSGTVIVTGMGKAGLIGQKIAATLSSTGTKSYFLHPAEAVHGDLGCLDSRDVLLVLSNSGETEEVCQLLPTIRQMQVPVIAMTASATSTLGSTADITLCLGRVREAGQHGLAPSTSTTMMLALGDALALVVSRKKNFTQQKFAVLHPGGSLGAQLKQVREIMRTKPELRIASEESTVREVFVNLSKPGRRTGAVMLVDKQGRLSGLFTDSDLAKLLEQRMDEQLDRRIADVMTRDPLTIDAEARMKDVVEILSEKKVSELPVVDENGKPIGLIDITDVIGLLPQESVD
jgi:arabinose-5-phosphate isomerase